MENENKTDTLKFDKKFVKNGLKVISFILVFVLLLEVFSITVFSKTKATTYKNYFTNAYNYVNEKNDTIDIVLMGNSNMYSCFVPVKMWSDNGYTSTIVASPHQTLSSTFTMLQDIYTRQSPKLLVLEADMFYEGVELNTKLIDGAAPKKNYFKFIPYVTGDYLSDAIQNHFTIFRLHDSWKNIFKGNKNKIKDNINFGHGYNFSRKKVMNAANDNMNVTSKVEQVPDDTYKYLNKILELTKKHNTEVMFINAPSLTSWSYARHNGVEKIAEENNIKYIDFNAQKDYKINYKRDFRDAGNHMNYYGAKKITKYLSCFINQNYPTLIKDKRNDASYSQWNDDIKKFINKHSIKKF